MILAIIPTHDKEFFNKQYNGDKHTTHIQINK